MTGDQYLDAAGLASTGHGGTLSMQAALELADQARVVTVLTDALGRVTGIGSTSRVATPRQRLALAARDGGCSFPECDVPPAWTQAHHIIPWRDDGPTSLDNLTLLCGHHHRTFEQAGWVGHMIGGRPHWRPPAHLDTTRTPRRNTAHDPGVPLWKSAAGSP